jgi:peptide/nickel transport system ATP-binding protein
VKLELQGVKIAFGSRVVVDIDTFGVDKQEIVGLVGESGSGKSMTALAVLGLTAAAGATLSGSITLDERELVGLTERQLRRVRGRRIAAIFQSPLSSFSPVFRVGDVFVRALRIHGVPRGEAVARAEGALREVLLDPELLQRYPHQLSGGQAQRIAIAIAVALRSEVLLADEPTSALDVTVQAEIIELLRMLRERERMSILFISHDLAVVAQLCDRVAVMRAGRIVESGATGDVLSRPAEVYTRELLAVVPRIGAGRAP